MLYTSKHVYFSFRFCKMVQCGRMLTSFSYWNVLHDISNRLIILRVVLKHEKKYEWNGWWIRLVDLHSITVVTWAVCGERYWQRSRDKWLCGYVINCKTIRRPDHVPRRNLATPQFFVTLDWFFVDSSRLGCKQTFSWENNLNVICLWSHQSFKMDHLNDFITSDWWTACAVPWMTICSYFYSHSETCQVFCVCMQSFVFPTY